MMDLPSLLRAQDDNLSQMQGLLAEEFDLLKAHRALALPALADRKQQLLVAIETWTRLWRSYPTCSNSWAPSRPSQALQKPSWKPVRSRTTSMDVCSNSALSPPPSRQLPQQAQRQQLLTYDAKGNTRSGTRSFRDQGLISSPLLISSPCQPSSEHQLHQGFSILAGMDAHAPSS